MRPAHAAIAGIAALTIALPAAAHGPVGTDAVPPGQSAQVAPSVPPPPAERRPRAVVRFAPDRLDDLLWENDLVAHRLYGPALEAKEPPSGSGIDVWAKRVRWPFMDRQLRSGDHHTDHGDGLDFYDVGRTRGAGGLGIWYDNKLWTSRNFSTWRIEDTGGDVARFTVGYRPWPVDIVRTVSETREVSLPLGSHFTRMRSTLRSDSAEPLVVGIGIGKVGGGRPGVVRDGANGRLVFWGPENAGHGRMGLAVLVDPATVEGFAEDAENYLILVRVRPGRPFTYYTGSAWDRGGQVTDQAGWEALVARQKTAF